MTLPVILTRRDDPCRSHACSACCHDIEMILTEEDVARLRRMRPGVDFYEEADDGFLQLRTRDGPPARGAKAAPGASPRPCVFLSDEGACTVHDDRPEGCRLYPATWDGAAAGLDDLYCPHTDDFLLTSQVAAATRRLAMRLERERRERLASRSG